MSEIVVTIQLKITKHKTTAYLKTNKVPLSVIIDGINQLSLDLAQAVVRDAELDCEGESNQYVDYYLEAICETDRELLNQRLKALENGLEG